MIFYILATLVVCLLTYFCIKNIKRHGYWSERGIKTAPSAIPFIGHSMGLLLKPMRWIYIDKLYKKFRSDEMWGMFEFKGNLNLHVIDLDLIRDVTVKEADHFIDRKEFPVSNEVFQEFLSLLKGERWKAVRSILSPTFSSGKLKAMYGLVQEKTRDLVTRSKMEMNENGCMDAKDIFNLYTMDVISTCAFGIDVKCLVDKNSNNSRFLKSANGIMKTSKTRIFQMLMLSVLPRRICTALGISSSSNSQDYLMQVLSEAYEERVKSGFHRGDYLDLLIEAKKKNDDEENVKKCDFTMLTVIAQAELFLLAGFDTTSSAITIISYYLAKNPSEQETLRKQLKKILQSEDEFNYQNMLECHYLEAVVNESLRLNPVVFNIERSCVQEFRVKAKELTIEKGTIVSIPAYSIHRDPQYWEDPEAFKPERFLPENKDKIIPFTFMPFGMGPRNCIAMRFAMMEIKLCIATMVATFEMNIKPGYEELSFDHSGQGVAKPSSGTVMIDLKEAKSDV